MKRFSFTPRRSPSHRPLRLEPLEQRYVPSTGTWQEIQAPTGFTAGPMILLSNGNVMVQDGDGADWKQLQPDASGNYANGTWPTDLDSTLPTDPQGYQARTGYDSTVLPDGQIFALGGETTPAGQEYLTSGLVYDPTAVDPATGNLGSWSLTKPAPIIAAGEPIVGDDPLSSLPNGMVLVGNNNGPAVTIGGDLGTIDGAVSSTATTIVFDASGFEGFPAVPATPFSINVEQEIMTVTHIAGTTWTVERGADGSTAVAHQAGAPVDLVSTLAAPGVDATATTLSLPAGAGLPVVAPTTLTAAVTASATSITVASTAGLPVQSTFEPFPIQVDGEVMQVTAVSGDTLTVNRGTQGTTAAAHPKGATLTPIYYVQIDQEILEVTGTSADGTTLTVLRGAQGTTPATHAAGAVVHLSSDYSESLIFNPTTGGWTTLPVASDKLNYDSSFEESWVKVPGDAGDILTYENNATFEDGTSMAEYFDTTTQTWGSAGTVPVALSDITTNSDVNEIGPGLQLPDGRVFQIGANGNTALYTPSTNSWAAGPQVAEADTTLAQAIPGPKATTIVVTSATGIPARPFYIEIDQEVMEVTAVNGTTWTVTRGQYNTTPVAHAIGATISQLFIPGDNPAAELPDGEVIFDAGRLFGTRPTTLFDYDPVANTITPLDTSVMPVDLQTFLKQNSLEDTSLLILPTGQMILSDGADNNLFVYTPTGAAPVASSLPAVSGIVRNTDGSYTLSGTQLNGVSEGAFYGDDQGMSENYPLVQLTAPDGTVSYARTYDWSTTAVGTGTTPESTQFALPSGAVPGTYELAVIAAGIASPSVSFTIPSPGTVELSAGTDSVTETGSLTVMVDRTGGAAGAVTVHFATADGTAAAGTAYTAESGTLTWADGDESPKSITIPITGGPAPGGSETFSLTLTAPTGGATLGSPAAEVITISTPASPPPPPPVSPPPPMSPPPPAAAPAQPILIGGAPNGTVQVYTESGGTYTLQETLQPFGNIPTDVRTAVGDVNGDGIPDYIFAIGPSPTDSTGAVIAATATEFKVMVLSGASGNPVLVQPFDPFLPNPGGSPFTSGGFVSAGDLLNNGRDQVVVSPDQQGGPRIAIYDMNGAATAGPQPATPVGVNTTEINPGSGLTRINNFLSVNANFRGGARTAVGDLNGDGVPDLAIAAGFGGGPAVLVINGTNVPTTTGFTPSDDLIGNFFAFNSTLRDGAYLAIGDVLGNGQQDLILGPGAGGPAEVEVLSGAAIVSDGAVAAIANPVANFVPSGLGPSGSGTRVAAVPTGVGDDVNVVVGAGRNMPGMVKVYPGSAFTSGSTSEPSGGQIIDPFGGGTLTDGIFVG